MLLAGFTYLGSTYQSLECTHLSSNLSLIRFQNLEDGVFILTIPSQVWSLILLCGWNYSRAVLFYSGDTLQNGPCI